MTLEILLYILGGALIPITTWAFNVHMQLKTISRDIAISSEKDTTSQAVHLKELQQIAKVTTVTAARVERLCDQHDHPEKTGFGTSGLIPLIEANTLAITGLKEAINGLVIWLQASKN